MDYAKFIYYHENSSHDENLVRGFLFNEQIIQDIEHINSIESYGEKVGHIIFKTKF